MRGAINWTAIVIHHADAALRQDGDIAIREEENLASVFEKRGDIAGDKIFAVAEADDGRRADAGGDDFVRVAGGQKNQGVDAAQLFKRFANRIFQRRAALRVFFHEMRDDFRVRLGHKFVAFALELLLQLEIIFNNSVVDDDDLAGAIAVRVRVFLGWPAVGGPTRVADAVGAFDGRFQNDFFEIAKLSRGAADFQLSVLSDHRNAS